MRPHFKIIDGGCHFGLYTLMMASLLDEKQGGQIFSFESNPISVQYVNASVLINRWEKRVTVYNYAIYNQTMEMKFNLYLRGYQSALDNLQQKRKDKGIQLRSDIEQEQTQIKVLAISLDDFFPPEILPEVHFIKLDIENAEFMAVQGGKQLIQRSKEVVIIMEL